MGILDILGIFNRRSKARTASFWTPVEHDECKFDIVGESHHTKAIKALIRAGSQMLRRSGDWSKLGVHFYLVPEPDNPYDSNAIGVYASLRERFQPTSASLVGHIDKKTAALWVSRINGPTPIKGVLIGKNGNFGVKLDEDDLKAAGLSP